jgi:hypothetical protein
MHLSAINGNMSSVPATNSISDNFGGCMTAPNLHSTLPVKLESFTATLNNRKTELKWETSSEISISHFVVERSTDGTNFSDQGTVLSFGTTSSRSAYHFTDNINAIQSAVIYYRLRSIETGGKQQYSDIRLVKISTSIENSISITTYPNPVTSEVRITIPANWQNKKVVYELFNANGQAAKKMETASSSQTETMNTSTLTSGLYFVKVTCGSETAQQKLIKQ